MILHSLIHRRFPVIVQVEDSGARYDIEKYSSYDGSEDVLIFGKDQSKKKIMKDIIFKFFALPISYILGHICMKGFPTSSYSAKRDLYAILLAMIPIYGIVLIANKWLRNRKKIK